MDKDMDNLTTRPDNPFKVPEGYFDSLTQRVMDAIPQNEIRMVPQKQAKPLQRWRHYAAAAAVVAALFGVGAYLYQAETPQAMSEQQLAVKAHTVKASAADSDFEAVADYIMCDDYDLYAYISNE